jgi:alkylated DNA repair dioxygenase AlkB
MTRDLFADQPAENILPCDGQAWLHREILPTAEADRMFDRLRNNVTWQQETAHIMGRSVSVPRLTAWFGDVAYRYSGVYHPASPMPMLVDDLRKLAEDTATGDVFERDAPGGESKAGEGVRFNTVLLNLYRDGRDSVSWHADDEEVLGVNPVIASLSFGGERRFHFRHKKNGERVSIDLPHNSALVMAGPTQHHWVHQVPKTARAVDPRINLTFRLTRPERHRA